MKARSILKRWHVSCLVFGMDTSFSNSNMPIDSSYSLPSERLVLVVESPLLSGPTMVEKFSQVSNYLTEQADLLESALAIIEVSTPDVLVVSVDTLSDIDLAQLAWLTTAKPIPVVIFARKNVPNAAELVVEAGVNTYIVDDVSPQRLPVILDLAFERFSHMQKVNSELEKTKKKLSERKLIEKAKGIVMRQKNYSEDEAYMEMRRSAMNQGQSMAELSEKIISLFDQVLD